jgi:hypothetical protein
VYLAPIKQDKSFIQLLENEMEEDFMAQMPIWIVATLGKEVALTREFVGACETYAVGCRGTLVAIHTFVTEQGQIRPYALVALDPNDDTYWENFSFADIRPVVDSVKFSIDIQRGVIAF